MTYDQVKASVDTFQLPALLQLEWLLMEIKKDYVLCGFKEAAIKFNMTYKYYPNTTAWTAGKVSSFTWLVILVMVNN